MIPEDWTKRSLGELVTLKRGFDLPAAKRRPGDVPLLAANGQIAFHDVAKVAGPGVVTGRCGTIGKVSFTRRGFWPLNTALYVASFHGNDPEFIYRLLERLHLERFAVGTGTQTLNPRVVHEQLVAVPPLNEQTAIAALLRRVDDAHDAARSVVIQSRKLFHGVRRQLFAHGFGHQRPRGIPNELPPSWRQAPLGTLCTLRNGYAFQSGDTAASDTAASDSTSRGLPIIRIQNLHGGRRFNHFAGQPRAEWIVEPGDLLFSWAGVPSTSLGPHLWAGPSGVLNQHIFRVEPRRGIDKHWLFETLDQLSGRIASRARGFKSTLQHLRKADLTEQLVALPPPLEQRLMARLCARLRRAEATQETDLEARHRLQRGLAEDLLTGRVRLPT